MNTTDVNAKITSTHLGLEGHGIFTAYLQLDTTDGSRSFGGYFLDGYNSNECRVGTAWGMEFVRRLVATVGKESWETLRGAVCRVRLDGHQVVAIGHFLEDRWFCPKTDLKHLE